MIETLLIVAVGVALTKIVVWEIKVMQGRRYRPATSNGTHQKSYDVSVVVPVLNEDPQKFLCAIRGWLLNKPAEIIIVCDYTDEKSIAVVENQKKQHASIQLIVTHKSGKRGALVQGFKASRGDIVVFADSDSVWSEDTLQTLLIPFANKSIGAVNCRNRVHHPVTFAQKFFALQINKYYLIDYPYLCWSGKRSLLSGRTTAYRRTALEPLINSLTHEMFMGAHSVAGDDSYLARSLQNNGWHLWYQKNTYITTYGTPEMLTYLKQMLRWYRDAARFAIGTLQASKMHDQSLLFWIDKNVEIAGLAEGVCVAALLLTGHWIAGLTLFACFVALYALKYWKIFPTHKTPWAFVSFYLFEIIIAFTQLYAIFTPNVQGWITRGRTEKPRSSLRLHGTAKA